MISSQLFFFFYITCQWAHVALTNDGTSTIRLFLNGALVGSQGICVGPCNIHTVISCNVIVRCIYVVQGWFVLSYQNTSVLVHNELELDL